MTTQEGYWTGPYGVLIPNNVTNIFARDGTNILRKTPHNVLCTRCRVKNPLNEAGWKDRYALKAEDGHWFYDTQARY